MTDNEKIDIEELTERLDSNGSIEINLSTYGVFVLIQTARAAQRGDVSPEAVSDGDIVDLTSEIYSAIWEKDEWLLTNRELIVDALKSPVSFNFSVPYIEKETTPESWGLTDDVTVASASEEEGDEGAVESTMRDAVCRSVEQLRAKEQSERTWEDRILTILSEAPERTYLSYIDMLAFGETLDVDWSEDEWTLENINSQIYWSNIEKMSGDIERESIQRNGEKQYVYILDDERDDEELSISEGSQEKIARALLEYDEPVTTTRLLSQPAHDFGCTDKTVRSSLSKLSKKGVVNRVLAHDEGDRFAYWLSDEAVDEHGDSLAKSATDWDLGEV